MKPLSHKALRTLACLVGATLASPISSSAQSESFDDGNDDGWNRFSPLDIVGASSVFTFPEDGAGGFGYRLQSPAPPVPDAGPGRTFTFQDQAYTDFYAGVDVIDWNNEVNQAFGILFRATEIGLGSTLGYVLNYDPQQASGGRGQIQFNIVTGEADQGTIGAANISFEPGRQYRIVMRAEGSVFSADVYDLNNLTSPLASYWGTDELYPSGSVGLFNFYRGGDATDPDLGIADTTFDNYFVAETQDLVPAPGAWRGIEAWPHVLNLTPLNRTAYHSPTEGIRFTASTLGGPALEPGQLKIFLNGRDRTTQANIVSTDGTLEVTLAPLIENRVYDARIEIAQAEGPAAITEWTFDTFSEDFLQSSDVEIIELEDYNFDGGDYIDNPPVSGYRESGAGVNAVEGYVDREGLAEVDFFDYESSPGDLEKAIYRSFDPVATQAGASETGSAEQFSGPDPAINDTQRSQYATLDLPEIQVTNTEGGEWLNYTREFPTGNYHVYLRGAGRATQEIYLDEVTSDPAEPEQTTERLGTFTLPNMGLEVNYRFIQLLDDSGAPTVLELDGLKTLRVTIGTERESRIDETTALNYLAFVPAPEEEPEPAIIVTSATDVAGPYVADDNLIVGENSISISLDSPHRFLKITSNGNPISITEYEILDSSIIIRFTQ